MFYVCCLICSYNKFEIYSVLFIVASIQKYSKLLSHKLKLKYINFIRYQCDTYLNMDTAENTRHWGEDHCTTGLTRLNFTRKEN